MYTREVIFKRIDTGEVLNQRTLTEDEVTPNYIEGEIVDFDQPFTVTDFAVDTLSRIDVILHRVYTVLFEPVL